MPIYLTCVCEKRLRVPDQFAGKRVRCTGCNRVLMVPQPVVEHETADEIDLESKSGSSITMATDSGGAGEPAKADVIIYATCGNCRRRIKGPASLAGKRGRCPGCGNEVFLPWMPKSRTEPESADETIGSSGFMEFQTGLSGMANSLSGSAVFTAINDDEVATPGAPGTMGNLPEAKLVRALPSRSALPGQQDLTEGDSSGISLRNPAPAAVATLAKPASSGGLSQVLADVEAEHKASNTSGGPSWMQQHQLLLICTALVLCVGAAGYLIVTLGGALDAPGGKAYFYDLGNDQVFVASDRLSPPITAPSGPLRDGAPAGVRAYLFSCGSCADQGQRYIGYFETYSKEAQRAMAALVKDGSFTPTAGQPNPLDEGPLVATPQKRDWVPLKSEAGAALLSGVSGRCGEKQPAPCRP